jgi:hypothetical protein
MRKILFSLFAVGINAAVMAQGTARKDYSFSAGVDLAYATGRFHYAHRLGYGISVQGEYLFADNSALTVGTGYMYFANKTFAASDSIDADIPTEQLNRFAMVPLQFGFAFRKEPFISATYAVAVGVLPSANADISLRFQAVQKKGIVASFFSVRAAYVF